MKIRKSSRHKQKEWKAETEAQEASGELSEHRMLSDDTTSLFTIRVGVGSDMDAAEQTDIEIEENHVGTTKQTDKTIEESNEDHRKRNR